MCLDCNRIAQKKARDKDPDAARIKAAEQSKRYRRKLRQQLVAEYGGVCACPGCGVTDWRKLTIDHINGNGNELRDRPGGKRFSVHIVLILKQQGWPKDNYQLLCWTCNAVKHFYPGEVCCA